MKDLNKNNDGEMRMQQLGSLHKEGWPIVKNRLASQGFTKHEIDDAYQTKFLGYLENGKPDLKRIQAMREEPYKGTLVKHVRNVIFTQKRKSNKDTAIKNMVMEQVPKEPGQL